MSFHIASIDIGTNTFRLLISSLDNEGKPHPVLIERKVTRLGGGFSNGYLSRASMDRSLSVLSEFSDMIRRYDAKTYRAVATSAVREALNGSEFIVQINSTTGLDVDIIDGREEARLALKGVYSCADIRTRYALVFDIGGGSTEYILADRGTCIFSESLALGVVHSTEAFLHADPPNKEEMRRLAGYIDMILTRLLDNFSAAGFGGLLEEHDDITLVGTAGTITALAAMDMGLEIYDSSRVNNYLLTHNAITGHFDKLACMKMSDLRQIRALSGGREDLILSGTMIVIRTMELTGFRRMLVSDCGLLEGVLIELAEGVNKRLCA